MQLRGHPIDADNMPGGREWEWGRMPDQRSFDRFTVADLNHLAEVAEADLADFVRRNPKHRTLLKRRLCVLLCQGAALHYVDRKNGVKDFDVGSFFSDDGKSPHYPARVIHARPFERASFRTSTRRIDLLGRTLKVTAKADAVETVQSYLERGATSSARHLSTKAVVVLEPASRRGEVIWPLRSRTPVSLHR